MLVDTNYANIHRTDVGDSEDNIRKVYKQIKEKMLKLYSCMCSEEVLKLPCINEISFVSSLSIIACIISVLSSQALGVTS